jgi:hypothetical protein
MNMLRRSGRTLSRPAPAAHIALVLGVTLVATTIVIVTGSTRGFEDLVAVVIALAALADRRRPHP